MALSSAPQRRYGSTRRRNTSAATFVLLLVLSHGVWNTLQCGTSSSQPKNQSPQQRISTVEDDNDALEMRGLSSTERLEEGVGNKGSSAIGIIDAKRSNEITNNERPQQREEIFQACQTRLLDSVTRICGINNFYVPGPTEFSQRQRNTLSEILGRPNKRSVSEILIQRRMTRSLVNECCNKSCKESYLRSFCRDNNRVPPPVTTRRPTIDEPEEVDSQPQRESESPVESSQLSPAPGVAEEPSEPAMYYPLIHFLKFMQRQFKNKNVTPQGGNDSEGEGTATEQLTKVSNADDYYIPLPHPEARVQDRHPHSQGFPVHSDSRRERQGHHHAVLGNPSSGSVAHGSTGITNSATGVASQHSSHTNHHHHTHNDRPMAPNHNHNEMAFNNEFNLDDERKYLPPQQAPRKSGNILTSTMPTVTLINLAPRYVDYEGPYRRK